MQDLKSGESIWILGIYPVIITNLCVVFHSVACYVCVQWCPAGGSRRHRMEWRQEPSICRELACGSPARTASTCRGRTCACAFRMGSGPERKPNAWFPVWINHRIILVRWLTNSACGCQHLSMCACVSSVLYSISWVGSEVSLENYGSLVIFFPNYIYFWENPKNVKSSASGQVD